MYSMALRFRYAMSVFLPLSCERLKMLSIYPLNANLKVLLFNEKLRKFSTVHAYANK